MPVKSKQAIKDIQPDSSNALSARRIWLRALAPIYFFMFALLRCYLETDILAKYPFFSYYTAWHHILWCTSTILMIILLIHLIIKIPVSRLIWLMYGSTLLAVPILYAAVSGEFLQIDYLSGSFPEIVRHILTFCLTLPRNRPLTIELFIIFFSMIGIGYFYSRSWLKAVFLAVAVHFWGNMLAIPWFAPEPNPMAIVQVDTFWVKHAFMAALWLHPATVLVLVLLWRAGQFQGSPRPWINTLVWSVLAWIVYIVLTVSIGWFTKPFDIFMSGLPVITGALLINLIVSSDRRIRTRWGWAVLVGILTIQLAVMGPIYLRLDTRKGFTPRHLSPPSASFISLLSATG